jgi:2-polyprenyl-3-methyl-5-hydroxy-6-metoxy-1,4-benzoquinol methylase
MKKEDIFRNTKNWYAKTTNYASEKLMNFASQYAEKEIFDVGCATGEYCNKLKELGFECIGIDINLRLYAVAEVE